jgi:monothiol glutaredoxin
MNEIQQRIDQIVQSSDVVLFMKGTAQFPMCGFSGRAIQILKACGVSRPATFNVLEDEAVRQGIKQYSNWPTIPLATPLLGVTAASPGVGPPLALALEAGAAFGRRFARAAGPHLGRGAARRGFAVGFRGL